MKRTHAQGIDRHGIHQLTPLEWLELTGGWENDEAEQDCFVRPETNERDYWYETRGEMPYSEWLRGVDEEARH